MQILLRHGPRDVHVGKGQEHFIESLVDELVWNYRRISYGRRFGVQKHFAARRRFAPLLLNALDSHQSYVGRVLRFGGKGTSASGWSKKPAGRRTPSHNDSDVSCNH